MNIFKFLRWSNDVLLGPLLWVMADNSGELEVRLVKVLQIESVKSEYGPMRRGVFSVSIEL
jgi:hypothetical protein